jgi:hypothetical protein
MVKIAAAVLGVDPDQLVGRIQKRSASRRRWIAVGGATAAGIVVALGATAAVMSINAREADALARQNVEKLLTDTRADLDEVGLLKVKAAVHEAAGEYFNGKAGQRLNNQDLLLKWEWLRQSGVDALESGDNDKALAIRTQAHDTTAELVKRDPDNPQFLFAHGQSAYYLGEYFYGQNDLEAVRPRWTEYLASAERLFEVAPDYINEPLETDAVSEVAYGRVNMGVLALEQHRNARVAANLFASAIEVLTPRATTVNHKLNLTRTYKQHVEALAQFALASEVLAAIRPWEVNLVELDGLGQTRRDLSSELATNWRTVAVFKKQMGIEAEAERDWRHTREIIDAGLRLDPMNKAWLRHAARLDATMGVMPDCSQMSAAADFSDELAARNLGLCLPTLARGKREDVCRGFIASFSNEAPSPSDRLIMESSWASLLAACSRYGAPADLDSLRAIAAERFFTRDYSELRIRTQLALSEFQSDDQWISGLNEDLKHRGWKGGPHAGR